MSSDERRAPGASRLPFEALVEVGGALGPSFEAHAVNVSEEGMQIRTAYLPEQGQPLSCRFETGGGQGVLAMGEVVWTHAEDKGGEFGVRFTDMDPESIDALKRICGVTRDGAPLAAATGAKVRLHIDGLDSPMRAKVKDSQNAGATVGMELGFLKVGRPLHVEDAQSGSKRPASIDRVEVQIDERSHVPQLVVKLRYADVPAEAVAAANAGKTDPTPHEAHEAHDAHDADELEAMQQASAQMKGALARGIARLGPTMARLASRAKTAVALLAAKRKARAAAAAGEATPRRTTAPPPGGGLHATGRRVVRGDAVANMGDGEQKMDLTIKTKKRKIAVGAAVMAVAVVGAIAIKKSHRETPAPDAATAAATADTSTTADVPAPATAPPPTALAATPPAPPPIEVAPTPMTMPQDTIGATASNDDVDTSKAHMKHGHVTPFGNGPVHHGNVLRLKMDGSIDSIEGAQQPTGFAVKIPGRKSLEAAGPLATRDSRIAAIKVSNDLAGAELMVAFKDGVPNYNVSAKGDTLVIALAPAGALEKTAKKDQSGGKAPKHAPAKHESKKKH